MSGNSIEITNRSAFKRGSLGKQVALAVVTLGLYTIYWWYDTQTQFAAGTDSDVDPTIQTVLFVIPVVNFYAVWKFSNQAEGPLDQSGVLLFVLFLVFAPAFWFLVQSGINDIAGG